MKKYSLIAIVVLTLVIGSTTVHADGHVVVPAGDPQVARAKLIQEYINTDLKRDALEYIQSLDLNLIQSSAVQNALRYMINQGIVGDIRQSPYVLKASCENIDGAAGNAISNDYGGEICLSPMRLAELGSSKAEIVSLAIHEHAYHFGFADKNYAIYNAVYQSVRIESPNWSEDDTQPATQDPSESTIKAPTRLRDEAIHVTYRSAERQLRGYEQALLLAGRKIENIKIAARNGYCIETFTFSHRAMRNTSCAWSQVEVPVSYIENVTQDIQSRLDLYQIKKTQLIDVKISAQNITGAITGILLFYCK